MKQCNTRRPARPLFAHDLQGILLGITGMDDEGFVQGTGHPDMLAERSLLYFLVLRRIEVVEPGLADSHHPFICRLGQQQGGIDARILIERVHTTGGKHLRIRGDRFQHGRELRLGDAHAQKISHVLLGGLGQHIGHIGLLAAIAQAIEMTMGINE